MIKRLTTVDEAVGKRYAETVGFGAPLSLNTPLGIKRESKKKNRKSKNTIL